MSCPQSSNSCNPRNHPARIWGENEATLTEDCHVTPCGNLVAAGKLNIVDGDRGEAVFCAGEQHGVYGSLCLSTSGNWEYKAKNSQCAIQALRKCDTVYDNFTVRSADGTQHCVNIKINGKNDKAHVWGDTRGQVTEDKCVDPSGNLTANGKLNVVDPDQGEAFFVEKTYCGDFGNLRIDTCGNWVYEAINDQCEIQSLGKGDAVYDSFKVRTVDGTKECITIKINGVNDPACITGDDVGEVAEDICVNSCGYITTDGKLTIKDVDASEAFFIANTFCSALGQLKIDKCGNWEYRAKNDQCEIQDLNAGECISESFCVSSVDGTKHEILIKIHGIADNGCLASSECYSKPITKICGKDKACLTEDKNVSECGNLEAKGKLTIESKYCETTFCATKLEGKYGCLVINSEGCWEYKADNNQCGIQALGECDSVFDCFTVKTHNGIEHKITIEINGVNDSACIWGDSCGEVTEDHCVSPCGLLSTEGKLYLKDVDCNESLFLPNTYCGDVGKLKIDTCGSWKYEVQNDSKAIQSLAECEKLLECFKVKTVDGTCHKITIKIHGVNDKACIDGDDIGNVAEDICVDDCGNIHTHGKLTIKDVDHCESKFVEDTYCSEIGKLHIDSCGSWKYEAKNDQCAIQELNPGECILDNFCVKSVDCTKHEVNIKIHGINYDDKCTPALKSENCDANVPALNAKKALSLHDVTADHGMLDFSVFKSSAASADIAHENYVASELMAIREAASMHSEHHMHFEF